MSPQNVPDVARKLVAAFRAEPAPYTALERALLGFIEFLANTDETSRRTALKAWRTKSRRRGAPRKHTERTGEEQLRAYEALKRHYERTNRTGPLSDKSFISRFFSGLPRAKRPSPAKVHTYRNRLAAARNARRARAIPT